MISLKKEQCQGFARDSSDSLSKTSDSLKKKTIFHMFLTVSLPLYVKRANCSCRASLFYKDQRDRFAFVALYKRVTVSELISSVFKQERWERLTFFHN